MYLFSVFLGGVLFFEREALAFELGSSVFSEGDSIPKKFTCEGPDVSVPLSWTDPPPGTISFSLIADDPDAPAGTWVHWVAYNIPAEKTILEEGVPKTERLADGTLQGRNDFGRTGYGGPCPPPGSPHRYFFKLYAVDQMIPLDPGGTKKAVLDSIKGHVLAEARLMGIYQR